MFVQVIQGRAADPAGLKAAMDRWAQELAPGAEGWLGSTAGVTEDGRFVALARFESAEVAQRNSDRPDQGAWWAETSKLFDGAATFKNSTRVYPDIVGNPDEAQFVQVMQGRGSEADSERAWDLMSRDSDKWAEFRPDVLGSLGVQHEGGAWTMAVYFTNEAEAREGERKEPPPELKAQMDEMTALSPEPPDYFDLKDPWLYAPR